MTTMATTMAADDDNEVDGNGATGDDDGDGAMGSVATGYDEDDVNDGDGRRRRQWRRRNATRDEVDNESSVSCHLLCYHRQLGISLTFPPFRHGVQK